MSRHMTIAAVACVSAAALLVACDRTSDGKAQAAPATGAPSPAPVVQGAGPRAVLAAIGEVTSECRTHGGRIVTEAGFDTRADLNGDGVPDHILDYRKLACMGASDDYFGPAQGENCGAVGCVSQIFLSSPDGHVQAFRDRVWAIEIERTTPLPRLKIRTHGGPECGASAAEGCSAYWAWSGNALARTGWVTSGERASPQATAPSVASGPIPIRTGYWAASCAEPDGGILYDGRRIGQIGWGAVQFWEPVGRVERSGRSYFLDAHDMMIEPLGADRLKLTIQDDLVLNYCPNDRLPASLRTIITRLTGR